jgi:hypothetical protein
MLAMIVLAVERYDQWLRDDRFSAVLTAAGAVGLAGLFKPFALHVGLTLLILRATRRPLRSMFFVGQGVISLAADLIVLALLGVLPTLAWVIYAASTGSLGDVVTGGENWTTAKRLWGGVEMLWSGSFWLRMQARLFDQMATPAVSLLALTALLRRESRAQCGVAAAWLAGALAYLLVVRDGNFMHDYYQLPFVPPFAMLAGIGLASLSRRLPAQTVAAALVVFVAWSALYGRTAFYLDLSSLRAGELARVVSVPGDLIVSLDPGSTRKNQLIYAAHRRGWHIGSVNDDTVALYARRGAKWLVLCLEDEQLAQHPEWRGRLGGLQRVAADKGPYGPRGEMHLIEVYRLPTAE